MASELLYGGDYNPEQYSPAVWAEDVRLMKAARVNTVTVGVFAWSSLEPNEGVFTFDWLDDVLDLLHVNGIGVILATPTASPPPWFSLAHPEALPVTADGVRLLHGSRDTYNPAAEAYRHAARRIATEMGRRYGTHPALRMWHVHNEYGTVSFGPVVDAEFRLWLERKYGALPRLNDVWNTAFWSQRYGRWAEVFAPQATQYLGNPAQLLDFRRFAAELLLTAFAEQADILRSLSSGIPVTTNFMLPTWLHYDQWAFAEAEDLVSIDDYPSEPGVDGHAQAAFSGDLARSLAGNRPWLLMEQATNLIYRSDAMLVRSTQDMIRSSLQYIARGSLGALFFQWRAPRTGAEVFHSSMVPHSGEDTDQFRGTVQLGELLAGLSELAPEGPPGPVAENRVAILWYPEAWWAADTRGLPRADLDYSGLVHQVHRALWLAGVGVDFIHPDQDLTGYDVVLLPLAIPLSDTQAGAVEDYVGSGGRLVAWYFSGTTDENFSVVPAGYGGQLARVLGIRVQMVHPVDGVLTLTDGSTAGRWSEHLDLRGAETVAGYSGGTLDGKPALTRHSFGRGTAHYVSTHLDDDALRGHLVAVLADAGISGRAGDGLEVIDRRVGDTRFSIALNHTDAPGTVAVYGTDLVTGHSHAGPAVIPAGGYLIVRA